MKRSVILAAAVFLILVARLEALPEGVSFAVRFYDQRIYTLGSPILVRATVTNDSAEVYRFRIADRRVFTVDFIVKTLSNRELPHSREFIIEHRTNQPVFYRDVSVQPGESFSFIEDITEFSAITEPGLYTIQAVFFPELSTGADPETVRSNILTLSVRPAVALEEDEVLLEAETGALIEREPLPPDDVVETVIRARQRNQWELFFLYLDLERLMLRDPERERSYLRMSQAERIDMLREYREALMERTTDTDILLVPSVFQIVKTTYTPDEGTVQVIERFKNPDFTEVRQYTYYLHRRDSIWLIYDYEVRNLGTE